MYSDYVVNKINITLNKLAFCILQKKEWKLMRKDILILNMIIERRVNVGILATLVFKNIKAKNKTILQKYNDLSNVKLNLEELRVLKKYIIEN